jgi:flagellar basal-body rod protein FlgF
VNYGLYISASGTLHAMYRMDTAANNLANLETSGFKPELSASMARKPARQEDGLTEMPSNELLEKLGGGVLARPTYVRMRQGAVDVTRNDLDVALEGEGFLVVRSAEGDRQGLTRDGRLTRNALGQLAQAGTGMLVLSADGEPIQLRGGVPVKIGLDGSVSQGARNLGRLMVADVAESQREGLRKQGEGFFAVPQGAELLPAQARVIQRALERSGVDPVSEMMDIGRAERAAGSGVRMIQMHDEIMQRAINVYGKLA